MKRPLIAVFGSSAPREDDPAYRRALQLGRALGRGGADVMTGGYGGAMEACSRGCHETGGKVVGVTVELYRQRGGANPWVDERVHTRDLFERLRHLIDCADGFIALPGSVGTFAELFLTWTLLSARGRPAAPLVLCGEPWEEHLTLLKRSESFGAQLCATVQTARDPDGAARKVLEGVAAPH